MVSGIKLIMSEAQNAIEAAQEIVTEVSPAPVEFKNVTPATDVKARLDWGESAFTIIDIRDRKIYNEQRIAGAIPAASDEDRSRVYQTLEKERDIYVYGHSDSDAKEAAQQLAEDGFKRVSIIEGGLAAWAAAGGLTEGRNATPDKMNPDFVNDIVE